MVSKFERLIGHIPVFKAQQETIDTLRQSSASASNELAQLRETIAASRNPGLSASPSDMLTERLLAHPVKSPPLACCRFRGHRVKVFNGTGGVQWRDGSSAASSSLRQ